MSQSTWSKVLDRLQREVPEGEFQLWIAPTQVHDEGSELTLFAPNAFVKQTLERQYLKLIQDVARTVAGAGTQVNLKIGESVPQTEEAPAGEEVPSKSGAAGHVSVDPRYRFDNFVQGSSNELAKAAALQVAENPGDASYNPLLLYGGTGLGKTHLLHAIGNAALERKPDTRLLYLTAEQFFNQMIRALQRPGSIDGFKDRHRSVDILLIDDIQFIAGKGKTQEEFFHTFNAMLEGKQQVVITCDRYPKELDGLEARLKSRFGWGLNVAVEPPDLETRLAILMDKAQRMGLDMDPEIAYFIGKRIRSNVREIEGALNTLKANARFRQADITMEFAQETLRDLLTIHERSITIPNIQRITADYYNVKVSDLLSRRRTRSIAWPRQMAMALAKELTEHSLPEIGEAFGGRDHTTVIHACRKIDKLKETDGRVREDYGKLVRQLTT